MTMEWFWGEEEYKTFVAGYKENALVNVSQAAGNFFRLLFFPVPVLSFSFMPPSAPRFCRCAYVFFRRLLESFPVIFPSFLIFLRGSFLLISLSHFNAPVETLGPFGCLAGFRLAPDACRSYRFLV
ncbi:unnamed protein product [Phaeothamnion confervicola]